jgi:hypothetical protein
VAAVNAVPSDAAALPSLPAAPLGRTGWPWTTGSEPVATPTGAWPRVTVVTPSFNQAAFLEEALRSVLLQGYPDLEYLVLDGGSTDGSQAIIERYAPWLAGWTSGPDGGQANALRQGFARATGDVLAWLNSDDVYLPGAVWAAVAELQRRPEAVMVYGDANEIERDSTLRGPARQVRAVDFQSLLSDGNSVAQPAAFFRRAAYEAVGGLDPQLHWSMDYDLWIKLAARGRLVHLPQPLAQMRIYPEAKTGGGDEAMFVEIRQLVERHGGQALPTEMGDWLEAMQLPRVVEAYRRDDGQTGGARLAFLADMVPAWRRAERLAGLLAGEAWRRLEAGQLTEAALVAWAEQVCADLPTTLAATGRVRQLTLGLLHQALVFRSAQQARRGAAAWHAWQAVRHNPRHLGNRGLWAGLARAWLRRPGRGAAR